MGKGGNRKMKQKVRWSVKDAGIFFIDAYNETTKTIICDGCGKPVVLIGRVIPPQIAKLKKLKLSIDGKSYDEIDLTKIEVKLHCPYCDAILKHKIEQPKEEAVRDSWEEAFSNLPKEEYDKKLEEVREIYRDDERLSKIEEWIENVSDKK